MAGGHARITANQRVCMGSGLCSYIAPDHFDVVDGVVQVLDQDVASADAAAVLEAVESCPTRALALLQETGLPS
jgi:ferredoxin